VFRKLLFPFRFVVILIYRFFYMIFVFGKNCFNFLLLLVNLICAKLIKAALLVFKFPYKLVHFLGLVFLKILWFLYKAIRSFAKKLIFYCVKGVKYISALIGAFIFFIWCSIYEFFKFILLGFKKVVEVIIIKPIKLLFKGFSYLCLALYKCVVFPFKFMFKLCKPIGRFLLKIGKIIFHYPIKIYEFVKIVYGHIREPRNFSFYAQGPDVSSKILLYGIGFVFVVFIFWAANAEIDERAVSQGQVVPSSRTQIVQSLEGGILENIYVQDGEIVQKGQELLKISDIKFTSTYEENKIKYFALLARLTRLKAEANEQDIVEFSKELMEGYKDLVRREISLFDTNRENLKSKISTLSIAKVLVEEQLKAIKQLVKEKILPRIEQIKLEKELNELKGKIELEKTAYLSQTKNELLKVKSAVDSLQKLLSGYKDQVDRTLLTSPVYGIIKDIAVSTIGQIIRPGENIVEIVPLGEKLVIEGKILPNDIAFIRIGQQVDIRVSAYDSSVYGTLKGELKHISADTIIDKDAYGKDTAFYKIVVESGDNHIVHNGRELPIIPGMEVIVNILTGKKTVLQYIMKPIIKTKQNAFGER
jgi:adhesin transport system membrane fusion protein